ncbi:MAG: D-tyrosyl-tRNA(Tyr) deacylase [Chloroflexi bacterium]|nr:D-tyrosyl-tRNA(Tyr) deacylase [Chloroflexota bacterium]
MRAVVQRVSEGSVAINHEVVAKIRQGLVILLGVGHTDTYHDAEELAEKVANLRIFSDADGKMNLSLLDVKGQAIVVSQFTLLADTRRGRRPSFIDAARPETAIPLYEHFTARLRSLDIHTETGEFGADMLVEIKNDGPVTIILEQPNKD